MNNAKPKFWIKNINDKDANGKSKGNSYMNTANQSNRFILHFLKKAKNLKKGDMILLFQKDKYEKRIFTHLVTPIDNVTNYNPSHLWQGNPNTHVYCREVEVVSQNTISVLSTKFWKDVSFQGISYGNACKITNVKNRKHSHKSKHSYKKLLNEIWNIFGVNNNNIRRKFP